MKHLTKVKNAVSSVEQRLNSYSSNTRWHSEMESTNKLFAALLIAVQWASLKQHWSSLPVTLENISQSSNVNNAIPECVKFIYVFLYINLSLCFVCTISGQIVCALNALKRITLQLGWFTTLNETTCHALHVCVLHTYHQQVCIWQNVPCVDICLPG